MNNPENLKPGQSTKPLGDSKCSTWYERSGKGDTLRLVRKTGNLEVVVRTWKF